MDDLPENVLEFLANGDDDNDVVKEENENDWRFGNEDDEKVDF